MLVVQPGQERSSPLKLDESNGRVALDSSGHHLDGMFGQEPDALPG